MTDDDENMGHKAYCGARLRNDNLPSGKKPYVSQPSHDMMLLHKDMVRRIEELEKKGDQVMPDDYRGPSLDEYQSRIALVRRLDWLEKRVEQLEAELDNEKEAHSATAMGDDW